MDPKSRVSQHLGLWDVQKSGLRDKETALPPKEHPESITKRPAPLLAWVFGF